jgi:3-hydroxyisobutyrate dehydrogenase-like beta-hydroxyacid dehydrogenase
VPSIGLKETIVAMSATNNTSAQNAPPSVTYGFIGLGVMGYGMAKNLRSKISKSSTLVICELVEKRRDQFVAETEGLLKVAHSPKDVAQQAVCYISIFSRALYV